MCAKQLRDFLQLCHKRCEFFASCCSQFLTRAFEREPSEHPISVIERNYESTADTVRCGMMNELSYIKGRSGLLIPD